LQIAAHELGCAVADIDASTGDSLGPDSGSSNASRTVFVVGSATGAAAIDLRQKILATASRVSAGGSEPRLAGRLVQVAGQPIPLADLAAEFGPLVYEGSFHPQQPCPLIVGAPHAAYSYSVQLALVEVDLLTGEIKGPYSEALRVLRVLCG